jgi:group I intron endonuclease
MPNIYLTINHHNKENEILPWRYIGSDQKDNPKYFGSSKLLKEDMQKLGSTAFEKIILETFEQISNKELRKKEETYLKQNDVKKDNTYYNLTDIYAPGGGKKGAKHRKKYPKSEKWIESRTGSTWTDEQKLNRCGSGNPMFGKIHSDLTKEKMSKARSGEKNPFFGKIKNDHPLFGFNHSEEEKQKRSERQTERMKSPESRKKMADLHSKTFEIFTPDNKVLEIKNLKKFCKENNLSYSTVRYNRKGWQCREI